MVAVSGNEPKACLTQACVDCTYLAGQLGSLSTVDCGCTQPINCQMLLVGSRHCIGPTLGGATNQEA